MAFDFPAIENPFLKPYGGIGVRDAALVHHDGILYCFYTASYWNGETFISNIDLVSTRDLVNWTRPRHVVAAPPVFWSPGNVLRVHGDWMLCMQDYRVKPGELFAGDDARLWLARSRDLLNWGQPEPMNPAGARVKWSDTARQIDPFLVEHDGRYWCFYKGSIPTGNGSLGLLVSEDLRQWTEVCVDRAAIGPADTPDGSAVENPCVVRDGDEFVLFFSPCRRARGIGVARSGDLIHWRDVRYLEFPKPSWIRHGPNAAMVIDQRAEYGRWLMVLHADRDGEGPHGGILGLAWSEDLEHWVCP